MQNHHLLPRNRHVLVASFVTLGLCVLEIFELVELPFESVLSSVSSSTYIFSVNILSLLTSYGYVSLFVLMLLESASLPIPSEIILPYAGYLVYSGLMTYAEALVVSTTALMVGALIDYYVGLKIGRPVLVVLLKWFGVNPEHARRAEDWVSNRGAWTVFLARFVPGVRSIISIPAGILRMKPSYFILTTFLGSVLWSALLIYLGYSAGSLWKTALSSLSIFLNQIIVFAIAAASIFYIVYYLASVRDRQSGGDSIS